MNIVLFGGSFDPIHNGHIEMAKIASVELNAEVLFVPAVVSVWKKGSLASFNDKYEMIKLAINGIDHLHVTDYENTTGKEQNYTYDTIMHFKEVYPNDKLFLLIGEDHVNLFHKWYKAEEISKLVQIVFFQRPDIRNENINIDKYAMKELKGVYNDASATNIRGLHDIDTPKRVLNYIADKKLYYFDKISKFIGDKRLAHSIEVAKLSYDIAKANGLDKQKAYVAALLHDVGKEIPYEESKRIMKEYYNEYCDLPKFSYHQFVGEYLAKYEFGIIDPLVLQAIKFHATGNSGMDVYAKIVYAADKIEPTRGFDSSDLINACMKDIESGFVTVLQSNKEYLESKGKDIENRLTKACFDAYLH